MSEWKEYKLGDLVDINKHSLGKDFAFEEVEYLDTGSVTEGKISGYQIFKVIDAPNRAKRTVQANDVIYSTVRPIQRHFAILKNPSPQTVVSTGFAVLTSREMIDPYFLYFYLTQDEIINYLDSIAEGSTSAYPSLTPDVIADLDISLPPLPEQRAIAGVLSSLDDKIDLLHRQNKTLEALAETLFRQWFVPVRRNDSEGGEEAENLRIMKLEELVEFDPIERIDRTQEYRYFDMKCLSENSMMMADGIKRALSSGSSFRNGDTLLAKITPCLENGKTGFVMDLEPNEVARGSTEFIVLRPKLGISPYYVYCLARSPDFRNIAIQSMTGTSGRQRVQTLMLKKYEVRCSKEKMEQFNSSCEPLFLKVHQNQTNIRTLTQMRDTLLPKLMSGEVRVNE